MNTMEQETKEQDKNYTNIQYDGLSTSLKIAVAYVWINLIFTIAFLGFGLIGLIIMFLE